VFIRTSQCGIIPGIGRGFFRKWKPDSPWLYCIRVFPIFHQRARGIEAGRPCDSLGTECNTGQSETDSLVGLASLSSAHGKLVEGFEPRK